jgi:Protein of unknown function (DUF1553)
VRLPLHAAPVLTGQLQSGRPQSRNTGAGIRSDGADFTVRNTVNTNTGGDLVPAHRLIMTSDAYRRASSLDEAASAKDPGNRLLWRFNRRRLESEAIRDSMLAVANPHLLRASRMGNALIDAE